MRQIAAVASFRRRSPGRWQRSVIVWGAIAPVAKEFCSHTGCKGVLLPHSRDVPRRVIIGGVITSGCRGTPQNDASTVPVPYFTRLDLKANLLL